MLKIYRGNSSKTEGEQGFITGRVWMVFKYTGATAAGWELETGAHNKASLDGVSNIQGPQGQQQQDGSGKQGLRVGRGQCPNFLKFAANNQVLRMNITKTNKISN